MVRIITKRNFIRALSALILAAASVFLAFPFGAAFASSGGYVGSETVAVSNGVTYDPKTRDFIFETDSGAKLHCSVLDGMVVSSPVTVSGGGVFLYKNGSEYTGSLEPVSEAGEYVVMINTGERNVRVLSFIIVGKTTNAVSVYQMPDGMIVNESYFNGEEEDVDYSSVSMEREGKYRIITECVASGTIFTLETTVDRTAPELSFDGLADKQGRYKSAVTISGLQKGEHIKITRDGQQFKYDTESDGTIKLTESGKYTVMAYDDAGNLVEYPVFIMAYINASGMAFIALLLFSLAAVVIYILVKRKKLRIG